LPLRKTQAKSQNPNRRESTRDGVDFRQIPFYVRGMNIVKATRQFEGWLGRHTAIVKKDLQLKHHNMKAAEFPFFRATYYRWAQLWPNVCPELAKGPQVLAVGDLHVENFGTWRDIEGRLIWGVNDFDEAHPMAYSNDLVRLTASAQLACEAGHLQLKGKDIGDAILGGYRNALHEEGRPFVLGEDHNWLRQVAEGELRDPVHFWAKMDAFEKIKGSVPLSATDAIEHLMPAPNLKYTLLHRVAGLGSLGHARYVAVAQWHGGKVAREAKALVSSASYWAEANEGPPEILYQTIINRAVRCPDPFVQLRGRWIVRRLSPHCSRIELADVETAGQELRLLAVMGWETANIHLGTKNARKVILRDLNKKKSKWLTGATQSMLQAVNDDWKTWKKEGYE
jgi:Uncharacterized protein conserved in bacteria (DUF2252)